MKKGIIYLKITVNLVIGLLIVLLTIFVLPRLLRFFMPFVIGWIISMIANPLIKFLEKRVKILRKHSSAIFIIAVIAIIAAALYGLVALTIKEALSLISDLPNIIARIEIGLDELSDRLYGVYHMLPSNVQVIIDNISVQISQYGSNIMTNDKLPSITSASNLAKNLADLLLKSIITILAAYFFTAERDNLTKEINKIMPKSVIKSYNLIVDNFKTAVGGYFKAQFYIMLIFIIILFVGFELLHVDYSFLLALIIAVIDFVPFFGTGAVLWPWALADFLFGNYVRAILLLVIYLICQIVKQVLQPKMVGDSIGISPLATLIFMFSGYQVMGVLGMIIGIPVGMILVNFYRIGMFDRTIRGFRIIIQDINEFRKF